MGSPIVANESDLVNLGKRFKKENITVDVVTFGSEPGVGVLRTLVNTLNGPNGTNNSFHTVPAYLVLSDYVVSSGLVAPNREPDDVDEDEELRRAIEWSMQESGTSSMPQNTAQPTGIQDGNDLSDDEQLRIALQLSLQEAERLEAIHEEQQPTNDARTATPEQDASPKTTMETSNPDNPPASTTNATTDSKSDKENKGPSSTNSNPNNNSNAAGAPSISDAGKTVTDGGKEAKKTMITKKDKNRN